MIKESNMAKVAMESDQINERRQDAHLSNESITGYHKNMVSGQVQNNCMHITDQGKNQSIFDQIQ